MSREDGLVTQPEVAELTGSDIRTVRRWTRLGLLPFHRLPGVTGAPGRTIRYDLRDVERFLETTRVSGDVFDPAARVLGKRAVTKRGRR